MKKTDVQPHSQISTLFGSTPFQTNNTTRFNISKTYHPPLPPTATINAQSTVLIEYNENVNQEYTILYHIEIFDKKMSLK